MSRKGLAFNLFVRAGANAWSYEDGMQIDFEVRIPGERGRPL